MKKAEQPLYTFNNTYMIFSDDLRPRSIWRTVWFQIKLRLLLPERPIARFKGVLRLFAEQLVFEGQDTKLSQEYILSIPYKLIDGIYSGYDSVYNRSLDGTLGMSDYVAPARIQFFEGTVSKTVYLLADYAYGLGGASTNCSNERFVRCLTELSAQSTERGK